MPKGENHYDKGFRRYVAKLVVQDGRKPADLERELGISYSSLMRWIKTYKEEQEKAKKTDQERLLTATEYRSQLEASEKARRELEEENDILKKALHIFAEDPEK
ncbi:transposase [Alkalicoccus halolimnae]|uniref:Transposase n=1 Tax=Alkalicoccus halolimnae TaxID=1667239 RepID=A0A5C7FB24_9BACI|nr:transposase [Alkalicoccus halolimnae]TXF80793.1 transposase [Alkalicoccus halolimnae]